VKSVKSVVAIPEFRFNEAVGISDTAERAAFLERACGGNAGWRQKMEALLASHDELEDRNGFLCGGSAGRARAAGAAEDQAGQQIGRYKLLQPIGGGGWGVAKATSDLQLTEKTLFTRFEMFVGTPACMSPEQAEFSAQGVDTRTDIYAGLRREPAAAIAEQNRKALLAGRISGRRTDRLPSGMVAARP